MTMPNFLIIGANRSGTSSLYAYLKQHPQVYMSPVKEPMFFSLDGKERPDVEGATNSIEDYRALFQGVSNEKAIGEASTSYLDLLNRPETPENIKRYIPEVKLIAILRNPVERAYSNYSLFLEWDLETLSFPQAVKEGKYHIRYVSLGFYYKALKRYFDLFDPTQIRVYLYEDLQTDPVGLLQDIFRFIGVDDTFVPDVCIKHNRSIIPKNKIGSLLTLEMRRQLTEVYREDIERLQDLIQRDLSAWLDVSLEAHTAKLEQLVISKDAHISNLEAHARELTTHANNLEELVASKETHIDNLSAQVARLTQELNTVYGSRTWRIASKGLRIYQLAEAIGKRLVVSVSRLSKRLLAADVKPAGDEQVAPSPQEEVFCQDPSMSKLNEILKQVPITMSPKEVFGDVSDDFWFWLHTEGYRKSSKLRNILPALPEEAVQLNFTGSAGDTTLREAFSAYTLFKHIAQNNLEDSTRLNTVLDFGCGWGRTIRFFLKDIEPSNLWGIDCFPEVIEICKQTNKWCNFELIDPFPPTSFPDDTFDLIYCYSVFSHLSEEAHQKWLVEFSRILRPGGLLIATTWHREFILMCAELRKQENRPVWRSGPAKSFLDTAQALSDYDSGKYLHSPVGGGGVLDPSFFGETCIPKGYVLSHWTKHFKFLDFIDDRNLCPQNVIVVKK